MATQLSARPGRQNQRAPNRPPPAVACDEGADSPHAIPSPTAAAAPAQQPISVDCALDPDFEQSQIFTITFDSKGRPNFGTLWNSTQLSCEIGAAVNPVTALEEKAYKTSRYDDNDIAILYTICAEVDPDDPYVRPGFAASSEQIPEMNGALVLCPNHPQSGKWRQAIKRGQGDVELEAEGRLFYAGTFLVGKEIKPGTYVTPDVEDCYWQRQNRNGDTIDNDFIVSARRVQITIRSTDYAFHSEGCGQWRPA